MKELSLRDIQLVSLDILRDIDVFCKENQITYFISYGTLLGAVRHKGFIPWDDDIDLMMPRPDYEKFINSFKSPSCTNELYSYEKNGCLIAFSRVCDVTRTLVKYNGTSWSNVETGIYIDIFPLDGTTEADYQKDKKKATKLVYQSYLQRGIQERPKHFSQWLKYLVKYLLLKCGESSPIERLIELCTKHTYSDSKYVGQFSCPDAHETILEKKWFEQTILLDFEGEQFPAPVGYLELLQNQFGDFMQLPPVEQRIPHISMAKFYWR